MPTIESRFYVPSEPALPKQFNEKSLSILRSLEFTYDFGRSPKGYLKSRFACMYFYWLAKFNAFFTLAYKFNGILCDKKVEASKNTFVLFSNLRSILK